MLTDARVTGILLAHLGAFGSGELKKDITIHEHFRVLTDVSMVYNTLLIQVGVRVTNIST